MSNFGSSVKSALRQRLQADAAKKNLLRNESLAEIRKQKKQAKKDALQKLVTWKNQISESASGGVIIISLFLGSTADGTEIEEAYYNELVSEGVRLLTEEGLNATNGSESWYPDHGTVDMRSRYAINITLE